MGEKANLDPITDAAARGTSSIVERTTTTVIGAAAGTGQQLADTIRDEAIGAVAEGTVDATRERLQRKADDLPPDPA